MSSKFYEFLAATMYMVLATGGPMLALLIDRTVGGAEALIALAIIVIAGIAAMLKVGKAQNAAERREADRIRAARSGG